MENTSHTNYKETLKRSLNVYLDTKIPVALNHFNFHYVEQPDEADLSIYRHDKTFIIFAKYSNLKLSSSSENLSYTLNKIIPSLTPIIIDEKPIEPFNSIDKVLNTHSNVHEYIVNFNNYFNNSNNVSEFIQKLFSFGFFKDYHSFHFFSHQKGSSTATHHHITASKIVSYKQSIKEFSNLFQSVKKSKNRSFGQADLKASHFQIIGTCIAHELSLKNHNITILVSRDNFLAQDEKDISTFKDLIKILSVYFEKLLNIEFNRGLTSTIEKSILELINAANSDLSTCTKTSLINFDYKRFLQKLKIAKFDHADVNFQERVILLGELLNTLRHELSNPLFGLELSSELLLSEATDEEQMEFLQNIVDSIKRSQTILNSFSQLYKDNLITEDFNINSTINEVLTLAKSEIRNIKIVKTFDKENLIINSNQTWAAQIIFNLIINSAQAMINSNDEDKLISITQSIKNQSILITIQDNGPGINKSAINKIFSPFYTTKSEGNGLGLAISKKLANKLGGDLNYIDKKGGACFVLELPL